MLFQQSCFWFVRHGAPSPSNIEARAARTLTPKLQTAGSCMWSGHPPMENARLCWHGILAVRVCSCFLSCRNVLPLLADGALSSSPDLQERMRPPRIRKKFAGFSHAYLKGPQGALFWDAC